MRVYLPVTAGELRRLAAGARLGGPIAAYAVTPAMREWYPASDLEELEYAALSAAARRALRELAAGAGRPWRRFVLAADVTDSAVRPAPEVDRAAVLVGTTLGLNAVAAVHADEPAAEPVLARAVLGLPAAAGGDEVAQAAVEDAEALELQWWATQELPELLAGLITVPEPG